MWSWKGPSTWPCQQTWARLWSNPSTCPNLSKRSVTGDDCPRITHFTITKLCFRKIKLFHNALSMIYHEIRFPAHFRHLSIQFTINKYAFSISSRTLWNVRMLVSISTLVDQVWNIVIQFRALSPVFVIAIQIRRSQYSWAPDSKSSSSIGTHFRQSFTQIRLRDIKAHITLDEFEWQNNEFVWKITNLILAFLSRLAAETNSSDNWRIWMLRFLIWLAKKGYEWQFDEIWT